MMSARNAIAGMALTATLLGGCQKPPESTLGQPVTIGLVSATVSSVDLAYLELEGPSGAATTTDPVLRVTLQIQNGGAEAIRYDIGWGTTAATQAQSPLLFVDPGLEIVLANAANIPVLRLGAWEYLDDPITEATRIEPGATLTDVLLFTAPPADAGSLLLSLPPALFGTTNKLPGYVRIPYAAPGEIPAPSPIAQGETFAGNGFNLTIDSTEQAFVRLSNPQGQGGFSTTPLLKVNFTVTNTGTATIEYVPERANRSIDPPALTDPSGAPIERAGFDDGVTVDTMVAERRQVAPGESLQTFLLFKRPDPSVTSMLLTFPGKRFGSTGLARFTLPYAHTATIPDPPELNPAPVMATPPAAPTTP